MLTILWLLIISVLVSAPMIWLLDNNGVVEIIWLGYELKTDVFVAVILALLFAIFIFFISYILTRILAIKFPSLIKIFFRRTYLKKLEKLAKRHQRAFEILPQLLLAIENSDKKSSDELQKNLSKIIKNYSLNNFLVGKIALQNLDFAKAIESFAKFEENKHAKILVLKAKFYQSLSAADDSSAIAYAKQILSTKSENSEILKSLFALYKKHGLWHEAKDLVAKYGHEKFSEELRSRDVTVMNSALASDFYQQKKFSLAIKHAKIALKSDENFLPALEILLKSWIKIGFGFKAIWKIKNIWRHSPHLVLAEIFDMANYKSSSKSRIKSVKNLAELNRDSELGKLAVAIVAFNVGDYQLAKEFAYLSILKEKNNRAYKVLAHAEKALGNLEEYKKNLQKSEMFSKESHYTCSSCGYKTIKWNSKCPSCASHDSLDYNF